jgi:hypothetical protein
MLEYMVGGGVGSFDPDGWGMSLVILDKKRSGYNRERVSLYVAPAASGRVCNTTFLRYPDICKLVYNTNCLAYSKQWVECLFNSLEGGFPLIRSVQPKITPASRELWG